MTDSNETPVPAEPVLAETVPTEPVAPVSPEPPEPAPVPDVQPPTGAVTDEDDIDEEYETDATPQQDLAFTISEQVEPLDIPNGGTE